MIYEHFLLTKLQVENVAPLVACIRNMESAQMSEIT
jgi:hypothetical protein